MRRFKYLAAAIAISGLLAAVLYPGLPFQHREQAFGRVQREAKLPGFRKGKVPRSMIKLHFADDVRQEVARRLIPDVYRQALAETAFAAASDEARPILTGVLARFDGPARGIQCARAIAVSSARMSVASCFAFLSPASVWHAGCYENSP